MDTVSVREDHEKIKARYYTSNHIVAVNNVQIPTLKQKGCCIKMYFLVPYLAPISGPQQAQPHKKVIASIIPTARNVLAAWLPQPCLNDFLT